MVLFPNQLLIVPNGGTDEENKVYHAVVVYKVTRNYKKNWLGIKTYSNYVYTVHWGYGTNRNKIEISHDVINIAGLVNLHK